MSEDEGFDLVRGPFNISSCVRKMKIYALKRSHDKHVYEYSPEREKWVLFNEK